MKTRWIAAVVIAALVGIYSAACGSTSVSPSSVASIALNGAASPITVGGTATLRVIATMNDGSAQDITDSSQLQVADQSIATVDSHAIATGVAPGTTTVTATWQGFTATATVTVTAS